MTKEPVYIIIPVHNRKAITLKCLETLHNNGDLDKYHVIVVDDGSTDGTSSAIQSQYPDVTILQGDLPLCREFTVFIEKFTNFT